jgi:hypothetical protein
VEKAVRDLKVSYPAAIDSDYGIWQAFKNEYSSLKFVKL